MGKKYALALTGKIDTPPLQKEMLFLTSLQKATDGCQKSTWVQNQ